MNLVKILPPVPENSILISDIPGYEHIKGYAIDKDGKVWSCKCMKNTYFDTWRILKDRLDTKGYFNFSYTHESKKKYIMVHKLVGLAFINKPEYATEINHKNGNKIDNRIDNLEWVSRRQNIKHSYDTLKRKRTQGDMSPLAKLDEQKVKEIKKMLLEGGTIRGIGSLYGVHSSIIHGIKTGKRWPHVS
jgi:hypothetical protein